MTSYRQVEANRRNALKSTGPKTEGGKQVSRCNAVRHGLTAETVLSALEDAEDYKAFEAAITADYDAQSAVERELVLRLASILWRLRRATTMETGLFEIHARQLHDYRQNRQLVSNSREVIPTMFRRAESASDDAASLSAVSNIETLADSGRKADATATNCCKKATLIKLCCTVVRGYGTVRVALLPKGPPRDRWLTGAAAAKLKRYQQTV